MVAIELRQIGISKWMTINLINKGYQYRRNYKFCDYLRSIETVLLIHKVSRESISRMSLILSTDEFCGAAILFEFLCRRVSLYFSNFIELVFHQQCWNHICSASFNNDTFFMSITAASNFNKNYLLKIITSPISITKHKISLRPCSILFCNK